MGQGGVSEEKWKRWRGREGVELGDKEVCEILEEEHETGGRYS